MRSRKHRLILVLLAAPALCTCATNPATGERQLILIGEGREIAMGREYDPQIVASMGLVEDPAIQTYVSQLGRRMAAASERPNLPWTFRVVDDPVVNAFAVPGGFIYITRGILAHFDSEAQLAAVLGHEIGHVTARHSVEQMSRAQLAQVGLVAGAVFAPDRFQDLVGGAAVGMQVLFLKYGRDDERQADELGFRYVRRLDYDPRPMADVYSMLDRVSQAHGGGRVPEWLSTHPNPVNRRERIQEMIDSVGGPFTNDRIARAEYLQRLDGLVFGANPREGFFEENLFRHPDLAFEVRFPAGWRTANQRQAVAAGAPGQDAVIQLTLAELPDADAAARAFLGQDGVTPGPTRRTTINGLPAVTGEFDAMSQGTALHGAVAFVEHGGNTYQLVGYAAATAWPSHAAAIRATFGSFDRLTDPQALSIQPMRLDIVTLDRAMTLAEFARRYPSEVAVEELALINQAEPSARFPAGTAVKRVVR
jgi:predicted Zn-dependent protease